MARTCHLVQVNKLNCYALKFFLSFTHHLGRVDLPIKRRNPQLALFRQFKEQLQHIVCQLKQPFYCCFTEATFSKDLSDRFDVAALRFGFVD
jgi:hypothetical protein